MFESVRIYFVDSKRLGRMLALGAALVAFGVYWLTLAQTITWRHNGADSGDLVTAAFVLGIPHPPGYPLYTLIAFFFARNPLFEPAHGVAIFSAVMASASVFVLARAGSALTPNPSPNGRGGKDFVAGSALTPSPSSIGRGGKGFVARSALTPSPSPNGRGGKDFVARSALTPNPSPNGRGGKDFVAGSALAPNPSPNGRGGNDFVVGSSLTPNSAPNRRGGKDFVAGSALIPSPAPNRRGGKGFVVGSPLTPNSAPNGRGGKGFVAGSTLTPSPSPNGRGGVDFVAPLGALGLAFSPLVWSQAIIPEVYALNLFLVALLLWSCVTDDAKRIYVAALAFGLGMAHHLLILLLLPGALLALQPTRKDWRALFFLLTPLLFYLYLPFAASRQPPINWGDPVTPERFFWLTSATLYRPYLFGLSGADLLSRLAFTARTLLDQFTLVGIACIGWGAIQMALTRRRLFSALLLMFAPVVGYAMAYASRDSFLYLLPALAIAFLWGVYGVAAILQRLSAKRRLQYAIVFLVALLPLYNLAAHYSDMDVSSDRAAFAYAKQNFQGLPVDAVLFADGDEALFALWYYRYAFGNHNSRAVIVSQGLLPYDWYYAEMRRALDEPQLQTSNAVADASQRAREIIRVAFANGRAICFTDSSPLLPEFEYAERGVVKCVVGAK